MSRAGVARAIVRLLDSPNPGFLTGAFSGVVLPASGPRLLWPAEDSKMGVAWMILPASGLGLGAPAEQKSNWAAAGGFIREVAPDFDVTQVMP